MSGKCGSVRRPANAVRRLPFAVRRAGVGASCSASGAWEGLRPTVKVLFVSHNHPEIRPGGAEGYALDVYEGVRDAGEFEAVLLSRTGPPVSIGTRYHEGRPITLV